MSLQSMFESLEGRQMFSVASQIGLTDAQAVSGLLAGATYLPAVQMPVAKPVMKALTVSGSNPLAANNVNTQLLVGKFKKGSGLIFVNRMLIKSVSADGQIAGKLSIPWIVSNASIRGTIQPDGRFIMRFAEMSETPERRVNGYFKGKMHPSGKYVTGTFKHYYGTNTSSGSKAHTATYTRGW